MTNMEYPGMPRADELAIVDRDITYSTLLREVLTGFGHSGQDLTPEAFYTAYMKKVADMCSGDEWNGRKNVLEKKVDILAARVWPLNEGAHRVVWQLKTEYNSDEEPDLELETARG